MNWSNPGALPLSAVASQSTHVSTQTKSLSPAAAYNQHAVLGDQRSGPRTGLDFASSDAHLAEQVAATEGAKSASPRLTVCPLTCQCDSTGPWSTFCCSHVHANASYLPLHLQTQPMWQISPPPSACKGVRIASAGEAALTLSALCICRQIFAACHVLPSSASTKSAAHQLMLKQTC